METCVLAAQPENRGISTNGGYFLLPPTSCELEQVSPSANSGLSIQSLPPPPPYYSLDLNTNTPSNSNNSGGLGCNSIQVHLYHQQTPAASLLPAYFPATTIGMPLSGYHLMPPSPEANCLYPVQNTFQNGEGPTSDLSSINSDPGASGSPSTCPAGYILYSLPCSGATGTSNTLNAPPNSSIFLVPNAATMMNPWNQGFQTVINSPAPPSSCISCGCESCHKTTVGPRGPTAQCEVLPPGMAYGVPLKARMVNPSQFRAPGLNKPISNISHSRQSNSKQSCHDGPSPNPRKTGYHKNILYKTEQCHDYARNGVCPRMEKCQFAHGEEELFDPRQHPLYKTALCNDYKRDGVCPRGERCFHVHELSEMRRKSWGKHAAMLTSQVRPPSRSELLGKKLADKAIATTPRLQPGTSQQQKFHHQRHSVTPTKSGVHDNTSLSGSFFSAVTSSPAGGNDKAKLFSRHSISGIQLHENNVGTGGTPGKATGKMALYAQTPPASNFFTVPPPTPASPADAALRVMKLHQNLLRSQAHRIHQQQSPKQSLGYQVDSPVLEKVPPREK